MIDRHGFPLVHCTACGGTGKRQAVPSQFRAWRDAVRDVVRVPACRVQAGDSVAPWGAPDAAHLGVADVHHHDSTTVLLFTDGSTWEGDDYAMFHRDALVDPSPYAERARQLHDLPKGPP